MSAVARAELGRGWLSTSSQSRDRFAPDSPHRQAVWLISTGTRRGRVFRTVSGVLPESGATRDAREARKERHFRARSRISISGGSGCADGFLGGVPLTLQWPPMAVREALYRGTREATRASFAKRFRARRPGSRRGDARRLTHPCVGPLPVAVTDPAVDQITIGISPWAPTPRPVSLARQRISGSRHREDTSPPSAPRPSRARPRSSRAPWLRAHRSPPSTSRRPAP